MPRPGRFARLADPFQQARIDRIEEWGTRRLMLAAVPGAAGGVGEEEAVLGAGQPDEEEPALLGHRFLGGSRACPSRAW